MKLKITAKELRHLGYPETPVIAVALEVMHKHFKHHTTEQAHTILKNVLASPEDFFEDEFLYKIAERLAHKPDIIQPEISLNQEGITFNTFGAEHIEQGAFHQMYQAAKLPISVAAALMPDAHQGYGLPIGGVLATRHAVIPYGVGVDIGCRMCLSIFDMEANVLYQRSSFFEKILDEHTLFGSGAQFKQAEDHEVMDQKLFFEIPLLKNLHARAWKQLGTSGSGNHFVEFGVVTITQRDEILKLEPGQYVALLSHSGSRALGANIANHYTQIARSKCRLPREASNLAWLSLDDEDGMAYWLAMNLAGEYAAACHDVIHERLSNALARKPICKVENHHNFAWKEMYEGEELIVHRKGATPAGKNVLGIIPGSMTAKGYIVKGKGEIASVSSAAHGAGRKMSRSLASQSISHKAMKDDLKKHGVLLSGGGLDEAPMAYKDIEVVMQSQKQLVDVIGEFTPKIVRMA
jgi:tRNA-splicing ligase RtcB